MIIKRKCLSKPWLKNTFNMYYYVLKSLHWGWSFCWSCSIRDINHWDSVTTILCHLKDSATHYILSYPDHVQWSIMLRWPYLCVRAAFLLVQAWAGKCLYHFLSLSYRQSLCRPCLPLYKYTMSLVMFMYALSLLYGTQKIPVGIPDIAIHSAFVCNDGSH